MPGDLKDPDQSIPYHYDDKYEPGKNLFEPGSDNLRKYLYTVALEKNILLSPDRMSDLIAFMDNKGFLCRNPGDESFRKEVFKYLNNMKNAGKVASKWLTLIS